MKKLVIKIIFFSFILTVIMACEKGEDIKKTEKVYVTGIEFYNSIGAYRTVVWTDEGQSTLPDGILPYESNQYKYSIFVDGDVIYVAGNTIAGGRYPFGKYWENGILYSVEDGDSNVYINSIYVYNGDVYMAGSAISPSTQISVATYWKNGNPVYLTSGEANSIFVDGSNVYVAGWGEFEENGVQDIYATYWKNGDVFHVSRAGTKATSICASGNNIYMCGNIGMTRDPMTGDVLTYNIPVFWENGNEYLLSDGLDYADASSIFVHNGNIYIAGTTTGKDIPNTVATYWKNKEPVYLTDERTDAEANSIFVTDQAVYVAGIATRKEHGSVATYWKNGSPTYLTDQDSDAEAQSIFVK